MASESSGPAAQSSLPGDAQGHFAGTKREYWHILSRDALQLIATLGLYRFWVSTDIRRYLWSRTEIAGEQLDYTGDPIELLVGFLVLLVVLGPLLTIASVLSLSTGDLALAVIAAYLPVALVVPLGILALYQARRYRVNHTVFRGLRFYQSGSAWVYALLTTLWFCLNVVTFGFTYPWARASLERYKMRHTFYGDVQGSFTGTGAGLFVRGMIPWFIVCGPPIVLFFILSSEIAGASEAEINQHVREFLMLAGAWFLLAGLMVYPALRAIVLRWRVAGMRFGTLTFTSRFSAWVLYKGYLKFFGLMLVLAVVASVIGVFVQNKIVPALPIGQSGIIEIVGMICLVVAYFAVATIVAFAYQGTVRYDMWRAIVDHLKLHGTEQIDRARAHAGHAARHAGRTGAALNLGGF